MVERLEGRVLLASWGMSQKDMWNTGRADYTVPANRLNGTFFDYYRWQARTPDSPGQGGLGATSMPFYDGVGPGGKDLVVGTYHWPKGIEGIDRHTGQILWYGNPQGGESIGDMTPAFSNDGTTIYVTNDATADSTSPNGHPLMAFASATGPAAFRSNGADAFPDHLSMNSPKVAPDGRVFLHQWNDRPYGGTDSGTALSQTWAAADYLGSCYSDPALYQSGGQLRVVATGRSGAIAAFNGTTGSRIWLTSTGYVTDANPTVDPASGRVYVAVGDNDVYLAGLDSAGNALWGTPAKLVFDYVPGVNNPQRAQSAGALSFDGGTYYFQTNSQQGDGRLYAINTATGGVRWSFTTGSRGWEQQSSRPIVTANGVIIVGNNDNGTFYAIKDNGTSATLLDTLQVDAAGRAAASATLAPDGLLYLPLRVQEAVGSESQTPSFQVQNLFTALDLTADPQVNVRLTDPHGLASGPGGSLAVAETGADRVAVFAADGSRAATFGATGSANGQFSGPTDVAYDPSGNLLVLDSGNARVQKLSAGGAFLSKFGSPGTGPGQLSAPSGIFCDPLSGRIYVADTDNQRVQQFDADGNLVTSWGAGGVVGTTGVVKRDHTGFDSPTDVAVNPVTGELYVADYGNDRIEVFSPAGAYVRTYLAVYRPKQIAFDASGNLYIAGEDPNNGYTAYDGRLRVLRAGEGLIGAHYTGGALDDIGRIETGVAVGSDGRVILADSLGGRLVRTDAALTVPASDLRIDARGTQVTFRWKTAQPSASTVRYGATSALGLEATDATPTTDHQLTVTGLTPGSILYYGVGFRDSFDGHMRFSAADRINTGVASGLQFQRLKVAGVIYTDANGGSGYNRRGDVAAARDFFSHVAEFYYRNSGFRLWADVTLIEIDKDITTGYDLFANLEGDLAAAGYSAADNFDAAWGSSVLCPGNYGGGGGLFGRTVGMCEFVSQDDWVLEHEGSHTLDSIYASAGLGKFEFNHGIWAVPGGVGRDWAVNGQILRNMLPANYPALGAPFNKVMIAPDADADGVPDSSPAGLTNALPITEATAGTSTASADSDGDGVSDLAELTALPNHGSNPLASDTDADGVPDAIDTNPVYRMNDRIGRGSPSIDGSISPAEGWTVLTSGWGFYNSGLTGNGVDDNNSYQSTTTTYAAWDAGYLYLAFRGPSVTTTVRIDGDADNWFFGPDNYDLNIASGYSWLTVRDNVGVPDIYRQIDNDGQYSEFFDTDPQFTLPFQGRTIFNNPGDGLGFPGRLVTESDIIYQRGGSGLSNVWEIAIPWSKATLFQGRLGKQMALYYNVGGDLLFETDHFARVTLVSAVPAPVITAIADDTGVSADRVTRDRTLKLSGTSVPSAVVSIYRGGTLAGTAAADAFGNWTFDYTGTSLAEGTHVFTATARSPAGNISDSSAALDVTVDLTAPAAPVTTFSSVIPSGQIRFTFAENVSYNLSAAALSFATLLGAGPGPSVSSYMYDPATNTATFTLAAGTGDGLYRATLPAPAVTDAAGNPLAASASFDFIFVSAGGYLQLPAGGTTRANAVSIGTNGRLDLRDGQLLVDYSGLSPMATLRNALLSGRNGGAWNGPGIMSSNAVAAANRAIGCAEAAAIGLTSFAGQPVDATAVVLKYTSAGDATLDGKVNADDYAVTDRGRAKGLATWIAGDLNYDGAVTAADYVLLDASFIAANAPSGESGPTTAETLPVVSADPATPAVPTVPAVPAVPASGAGAANTPATPPGASGGSNGARIVAPVSVQMGKRVTIQLRPPAARGKQIVRYGIDWNGDGRLDQVVSGRGGVRVSHVFRRTGVFNVKVSILDQRGRRVSQPSCWAASVVRPARTGAAAAHRPASPLPLRKATG